MDRTIRITIADDHPLVVSGLEKVLSTVKDFKVISTFQNGAELLEGLKTERPDVLLLDLQMPVLSGQEVAPQILELHKEIKIIALTSQESTFFVRKLMKAGVSGYILKTSSADQIVTAIREVIAGNNYVEAALKEKLLQETLSSKKDAPKNLQLTRREQEILQLISSNYTSQEIADKLFVSKRTIDNHRLSLLLKFGVKNSAALIKDAIRLGFITQ